MNYKEMYERECRRARQAELELREERTICEAAVASMQDFVFSFYPDGRVRYANAALLAYWRRTMEEAIGKTLFQLDYPPHLAERLQQQIETVVKTREPVLDQMTFPSPETNELSEFEYILVPVTLPETGEVLAVSGSSRDITAVVRLKSTNVESEMRFSDAFANAPVGLILANPAGEFLNANQAYLNMVGYTLEELAGRTSDHFTHPEDVAATHTYGGALRTRQRHSGTIEKRYIRKDGTILWARATGTMRYDAVGNPSLFIAVIEDITQQKLAEEALRRSEENLRHIFTQAPVAICVLLGSELRFDLVNPFFERLLPGRELLNRRLLEAVPELDSFLPDRLRNVIETGEPIRGEEFLLPLRHEDGEMRDLWFTFVCHPLREPAGGTAGVVVIAVDVTSHIVARRQLELANSELAEFAFVASHDLQEPIRMVNIYAQRLMRGLENGRSTEDLSHFAGEISKGAYRMEDLTRDLLSYSRANHDLESSVAGDERADLNLALRAAVESLEGAMHEVGATLQASPGLPLTIGNESQYTQVFHNLLSNALKYRVDGVAPRITLEVTREDGEAIIAIRDNGIGFDQIYAERIFGLFKRLHHYNQYPGTGLGLAICKRIVERYNGRIWASSKPGEGSVFYFSVKT